MTNCCDEFGTCTRGANCPARAGKANTVPPEAGNFYLLSLDPQDDDGEPLSRAEVLHLVFLLLVALGVVWLLVALVSGALTGGYAELLWAYLAALS